jgi:hypothetical protein
MFGQGRAPFFIAVDQHFRIGMGTELMAFLLQLDFEVLEIEDFAIVNDANPAVFIKQGLTAVVAQVDDRQALMSEADAVGNMIPFLIRPAMLQQPGQSFDQIRVLPVKTRYTAHVSL